MSNKTVSTIECPRCHQQLPGWADVCQFCGYTLTKGFVRPVDAYQYKVSNRPTWTEAGYIVIGVIITAQGGWELLQAFKVVPSFLASIGGESTVGIYGAIDAALGLGMLFHQIWAQFIIKLICWLTLAWSTFGVLFGLIMFAYDRHHGLFYHSLWATTLYGMALYLINVEGDA